VKMSDHIGMGDNGNSGISRHHHSKRKNKSKSHEVIELKALDHHPEIGNNTITEDLSSQPARQPGQRKPFHQKLWKTPKETMVAFTQAAAKKAAIPLDKLFVLGISSGLYISMAGVFALTAEYGAPNSDPGIQRLIVGVTFPIALFMIVFLGGELFTGNVTYAMMGLLAKTISFRKACLICAVAYIANFIGCAMGAYFFAYLPEMFSTDPWNASIRKLAVTKTSYGFGVMFLRGIVANWFVNIAIWVVVTAEDVSGKCLGLFYPIMAFAVAGYEHCVANMFYVITSLLYGADTTFGKFIYRNLIPVTLGNIVGGAFCLGFINFYIYGWRLRPESPLEHREIGDSSKKSVEEMEGHCIEFSFYKF